MYTDPPLGTRGESCAHLAGMEASPEPRAAALQWSDAHRLARFFGDVESPFAADAALIRALGGASAQAIPVSADAWGSYAVALGHSCHVDVWPVPSASAPTIAEVTVLRPGAAVERRSERVVLDLRGVPEGPTLREFLRRAASVLLSAQPTTLRATLREHSGMRDEAFSPLVLGNENAYASALVDQPVPPWMGAASADATLAILTGDRIAPSAARFAIALRAQRRAAIIGAPIALEVAEMDMVVAGAGGFATRTMRISTQNADIADTLGADYPATRLDEYAAAMRTFTLPSSPPSSADATRTDIAAFAPMTHVQVNARTEEARIGALIVAHGAAKEFFPYWDVVRRDIDERLATAIALPAPEMRTPTSSALYMSSSLRWLSNALEDSHGFVWMLSNRVSDGRIALDLLLDETRAGDAFVRVSRTPAFQVGDVIVSLDGVPAATAAQRAAEYMASSRSSLVRNRNTAFSAVTPGSVLRVRSTSGAERDVTVTTAMAATEALVFPSERHGDLSRLGRPDLFYVNIDGGALLGADLGAIRDGLQRARGLVLDCRGYPGPAAWTLIEDLLFDGSPGVKMFVERHTVFGSVRDAIPQAMPPKSTAYRGPIIVLVGPGTQSSSEHFVLTLQAARRATVIGRPSAGANGNITCLALPGQFGWCFTGMVIQQANGQTFHGVGVIPDERLDLDPARIAAGHDPELERAIELLPR